MIPVRPVAVFLVRILLGLIFVISGLLKFTDLHSFAATIKSFDVVPDLLDSVLAVAISSLELISGLMLLVGLRTKFCSAAVGALLIVFIAAMIPSIVIGNEIDCGCFGPLSQSKVGVGLLFRDVVMLTLVLLIVAQQSHRFSLDNLMFAKRS